MKNIFNIIKKLTILSCAFFILCTSAEARMIRNPQSDIAFNIEYTEDIDYLVELEFLLRDLLGDFIPSDADLAGEYEAVIALNTETDEVIGGFFFQIDRQGYEPEYVDDLIPYEELDIRSIPFLRESGALGVKESYQGRGIGKQLFRELVEIIAARGYKEFQFLVTHNAVTFWKEMGAEEIEYDDQRYLMQYTIH